MGWNNPQFGYQSPPPPPSFPFFIYPTKKKKEREENYDLSKFCLVLSQFSPKLSIVIVDSLMFGLNEIIRVSYKAIPNNFILIHTLGIKMKQLKKLVELNCYWVKPKPQANNLFV